MVLNLSAHHTQGRAQSHIQHDQVCQKLRRSTSFELIFRSRELDSERLGLYPNLDYKELYDTLYEFIPDLRIVNSSYYSCGKGSLQKNCPF